MSDELSPEDGRFLLGLARRAIENHLAGKGPLRERSPDPRLRVERGAFVTLHVDGELRGCIGYPLPVKPLDETITEMAVAAASQDFRFSPLKAKELDRLKIEVSVLSLPRPVGDPSEVEVGRDGIIVSKGFNRGLLLPQVPVEQCWDRDTYLRHGCIKAGLRPDEWRKGAGIEVFTAQVFSE